MLAALSVLMVAITGSVLKGDYVFLSPNWQSYSVSSDTSNNPVPNTELFKNIPRFVYAEYGDKDSRSLILSRSGKLYKTGSKDSLKSIARRYVPNDKTLDEFLQEIVNENSLPPSALLFDYSFEDGTNVFLPGVSQNIARTTEKKPYSPVVKKTKTDAVRKQYVFPLSYRTISSYFGYRTHPTKKKTILHKGCDFRAPLGTPVYAAREGKVIESGWERGYGKTVEIRHSDGYVTRYAHLSAITVKKGDSVSQGVSKIGEVGKSGLATGYHLHFELINPNGRVQNPLPLMKKK